MKNDSVVQRSRGAAVRLLPLAAALISVFATVSDPCFSQVQQSGDVVDESGQLWVGRDKSGLLLIQGGATHTSDTAWIGERTGSNGLVTVSDPGST